MAVANWFNSLRARIWSKTEEQVAYRESEQSREFEKWFCRGYEAALAWVLEQAADIHETEQLLAMIPKSGV
jgi:hypothetical protein